MNSQTNLEALEKLGKSIFARGLEKYLKEELEKINDISTPQSWDEVLERRGKAKFIGELMSLMEGKETVSKDKNQYT